MNKFLYFLFISLTILITSCTGDNKASVKAEVPISSAQKNNRAQAASVIEHRKKEEAKPMAMMVANYWEYEFKFQKQKMSAEGEFAGEWIKFNDDWTYTYGKYEKTNGGGAYHHSFDNAKLVMLDNDINVDPVEYETKYGTEVIILVGRPTFGQNGNQMKLKKSLEQPKQ